MKATFYFFCVLLSVVLTGVLTENHHGTVGGEQCEDHHRGYDVAHQISINRTKRRFGFRSNKSVSGDFIIPRCRVADIPNERNNESNNHDSVPKIPEEDADITTNGRPPGLPALRKTSGTPTLLLFGVLIDAVLVFFTVPNAEAYFLNMPK